MFARIIKNGLKVASIAQRASQTALPAAARSHRLQTSSASFLQERRWLSTSQPRPFLDNDRDYEERESRPARQELPPSTTLFVGNMPFSVSEDDIRTIFAPYGDVKRVHISVNMDGTQRGFAHVEFVELVSAKRLMESDNEDPIYFLGRDLNISYAAPRKVEANRQGNTPYHTLYFYDFHGEEKDLEDAFEQVSDEIVRIRMLRDPRTGKAFGNGFVQFIDVRCATKALENQNGLTLPNGWPLNLSYANPNKKLGEGHSEYGTHRKGPNNRRKSAYGGEWGESRREPRRDRREWRDESER